jgi:hypothetical protein
VRKGIWGRNSARLPNTFSVIPSDLSIDSIVYPKAEFKLLLPQDYTIAAVVSLR